MSKRKTFFSRVFWFGIGGSLSVFLNVKLFKWFILEFSLPNWEAIAISFALVTTLNLFWNYHVNFKSHRGWKDSTIRYFIALGFCFSVTYLLTLYGFHLFDNGNMSRKQWIAGIVQVGGAGLKFLVYHFWVYPEKHGGDKAARNLS